ncbi:T9SS type A sorting domain-containing protein [Phaeodactylibacter xiamenensis]|uniref:T9SS type A sorting domain-containing protein n=1 Tax=Phaeodactylibacter xiamenensis TaxID=1524460 RepID=UPI003BA94D79
MLKYFIFSIMVLLTSIQAEQLYAQRIYGAEVYKEFWIDNATIEAWVWRQGGSKPLIMYDWGDGSSLDSILLFNSLPLGYYEGQNYYLDIYRGMHKYDTTGVYIMGFRDSFLVDDIVNIEESGIRNLELYDTVALYPQSTGGLAINTTPRFFTQQGNINDINGNVVFNIDVESDESFATDLYNGELAPFPAEGYSIPESSDSIYMAPPVGAAMIWDDPIAPGRYAVGIVVRERRKRDINGGVDTFFLSTTMRAMTMLVTEELILSSLPGAQSLPAVVSIYPNPAASMVNIDFAAPGQSVEVAILNLEGKVMRRLEVEGSSAVRTEQIDVADWPSGVYLLRLQTGSEQVVRRFVVE